MSSPFPGMDPYLEQYWRDVHHGLVTYGSDQIQPQLSDDLRARIDEREFIEFENANPADEPMRQGYIEIIDLGSDRPERMPRCDENGYLEMINVGPGPRVVTVIEFVSPTNKLPGEGRQQYRQKQQECMDGGVSLVEIDLTREGDRWEVLPIALIPPDWRTTYQICVRGGWIPTMVSTIYRVPLQEPLPTIRIPLRESDADVTLDLQTLIEQCYRNGRYDDIDYKADPIPPLNETDAAWAAEWLRAKGAR